MNETEVLKTMDQGRHLFIAHYFYSEMEGLNDQILVEYCPLGALGSYLDINKQYISL